MEEAIGHFWPTDVSLNTGLGEHTPNWGGIPPIKRGYINSLGGKPGRILYPSEGSERHILGPRCYTVGYRMGPQNKKLGVIRVSFLCVVLWSLKVIRGKF